ncbi:Asp-tRNA(Asn)/Glu-tRNA(Gln) amidotransferase subunit GatA, partial [Patescibacteria group bacterium]|nr:Asp-tRNA(Asn)/Glu-tRNA(Gln) amidotransferase subunit GatA [Patescibacteria group bacterium]
MSKLNELSVIEAREGLKSKRFTSVELTTACLAEIDRLDSDVKAFITVLPDHALGLAAEADKLIAAQGAKIFETYPLLGIPYACKDNYSTLGIETTAASAVLKGYIPPYESTVT